MKRSWAEAAATAAFTSLLFAVGYTACNYLTRWRPDVSVWAFEWERHWPLVPAMIVPYWSIDLFFVLAPFVCRTREELAVHRRRVVFVIVAGLLGFVLIPLEFAFPRPEVDGVFGPWFAALHAFDFPHNLFPSLHIALRTLLVDVYARRFTGACRWATHAWFSLIGLSTLLTWQHHTIDVLGGFWLAGIALHLFRFDAPSAPDPTARSGRNPRVGLMYAGAAIACTQLARVSWPATFIFIWPAFALGTIAYGYFGYGSIYRKRDGRLTRATRLLFLPLLAGQWISWWHYRRQSPRWNKLAPGVWLGPVLREREAEAAVAAGVTAVLDLTAEFSAPRAFRAVRHRNLPVLDLTAPTPRQLATAVAFIEAESAHGIVYIHCKAGYSRTAGAAGAWLLATGRAVDSHDAIRQLLAARPGMVIRPEIRAALQTVVPEPANPRRNTEENQGPWSRKTAAAGEHSRPPRRALNFAADTRGSACHHMRRTP